MLVYKCSAWQPPTAAAPPAAEAAGAAPAAPPPLESLPEAVRARMAEIGAEFEGAVARHAELKAEAERSVAARQQVRAARRRPRRAPARAGAAAPPSPSPLKRKRARPPTRPPTIPRPAPPPQMVRSTLAAAPVPPGAPDPGFFVPAPWLDAWANADAPPGPAPVACLRCAHGGLDPRAWQAVKYVSAGAWESILVSVVAESQDARACALWGGVGPRGMRSNTCLLARGPTPRRVGRALQACSTLPACASAQRGSGARPAAARGSAARAAP